MSGPHTHTSLSQPFSPGYVPGPPGRASHTAAPPILGFPWAPGWLVLWLLLQAQLCVPTSADTCPGAQHPDFSPLFATYCFTQPLPEPQPPSSTGKYPRCNLAYSHHPLGTQGPQSFIGSALSCTGRSFPGQGEGHCCSVAVWQGRDRHSKKEGGQSG